MAPCQSRQLVIYSLPFAVLVAFFWYRRRRSLSRSDPGGTQTSENPITVDKSSHNGDIYDNSANRKDLNTTAPLEHSTPPCVEELCKVDIIKNILKEEEAIKEVVEEKFAVAESVNPTESSFPLKKEIHVTVGNIACVDTPIKLKDQLDLEDSNQIFHSTVIEEEKYIDKVEQNSTVKEEEEEAAASTENPKDIEEGSENNSSVVVESGASVQNSDVQDTEIICETANSSTKNNLEPVKRKESVSFEEQNIIGGSALRKHKKAAKKAEKKSKRQEKSLKLSSLFNSSDKTDHSLEDNLLSDSKDQGEGENTSSDSGFPSSEDNMAQGQKTEDKADNSAVGLEQKLASLGLDTVQSSIQRAERDSANHSPAEVMLNSPAISTYSDAHSEGSSDSGKGCSDVVTPPSRTPAGGSSVAGDQVPSIFEFVLPQVIVGRLIGRHGSFLQDIRGKTHTNVFIKRHPETNTLKICAIEGTQQDIDAALKMIRQKFPLRRFPELTLERVSFVKSPCLPINPENLQLHLVEGVNNDVILSSLITAGHFFLQLPSHMSYQSLYHLQSLMNSVYNSQESPCLHEPQPDVVCVAPTLGGGWYRAQILSVDKETDTSSVKFLDYGGYLTVENAALRQIRGDFLLLPFQAVECVLANVVPAGGEEEWSEEATKFVHQMTTQQTLQAQVYDYTEAGQPLVYLYCTHFFYSPTEMGVLESKVVLLNQELVSRGFADLVDSSQEDNEVDATAESS